ncbi:helix-turn-helix domain-containing protein [Embleya sp. AB8]|uniref:helix-turn-helix domain-containing protein n=1 Tax=Embleya sp. AB8 TaxID=3156304 RepID=UPI003C779849
MWDLFGAHLRFHRKLAGMTQQKLGGDLHSTGSFVGQIETAERRPSLEFVADIDRALGGTGLLIATAFHAYRLAEGQGWFETFAESERQASRIRTFQPQAIPGLLQCEEYIRALLHKARFPPAAIESGVARRLKRKRLLTKTDAPQYWAAVDEAALLRLKHDPQVAGPQLAHLLEVGELSNVVLEVVPMDCGLHPCMDGPFVLLSIPGRGECAYAADGMVEGQMITEGHVVAEMQRRYDLLRAEALSPSRSQRLLRDLLEST